MRPQDPGRNGPLKVIGSTVFVSGANRGLGRALVAEFLEAGCHKVYAGVRSESAGRDISARFPERLQTVDLDITSLECVAAAAALCRDVNILVNNAGIVTHTALMSEPTLQGARQEMEVNYFGPLAMCRAFAPGLAANGGGAIVNILSLGALVNIPRVGTYSAAKAAAMSMTQGMRAELAGQGTHVLAAFPGAIETDMKASSGTRTSAAEVAKAVVRALDEGLEEVFPDSLAREAASCVASALKSLEKRFASMLPGTAAETARLLAQEK